MSDILITMYEEIESHLLQDERPSDFLVSIYNNPLFCQHPFHMLHQLRQTEQSPIHHPEGNVWNHTLLVVDEAVKVKHESQDPKVFMWAALLHDIGKPSTTKRRKGKITAYNHDRIGAELTRDFLSFFLSDDSFINDVCGLVRYHMQILYATKNPRCADIAEMMLSSDVHEVALLGFCDRMGRLNSNPVVEKAVIQEFLMMCQSMAH